MTAGIYGRKKHGTLEDLLGGLGGNYKAEMSDDVMKWLRLLSDLRARKS
jgi:hypothetical protein